MFLKRSSQKEMMDDFSINDNRIDAALDELKIINKFLGGNSVSGKGIEKFYRKKKINSFCRILDIGSGSSDLLIDVKKSFPSINIVSLDKSRQVCSYAKRKNGLDIICGDAFNLPFKNDQFDLIHASLFLHHFNEDEVKCLLAAFLNKTKKGVIINELRRNIFAFLGIKMLTAVLSKSIFVKNDAPLSVRRGFLKQELQKILINVPASGYIIKRKWAFRWLVILYK